MTYTTYKELLDQLVDVIWWMALFQAGLVVAVVWQALYISRLNAILNTTNYNFGLLTDSVNRLVSIFTGNKKDVN